MTDTSHVPAGASAAHELVREARDLLLELREDQDAAVERFRWPRPERFDFAADWFDHVAARRDTAALWLVEEDGSERQVTYPELAARSKQVASWLRGLGVARGDRIVVMLGNQVELWEVMLAAIRLGAVVIPATTLLAPEDVEDRVTRGEARHVVVASALAPALAGVVGGATRIAVGEPVDGWVAYADSAQASEAFEPDGVPAADDPLLLYFTSGTTSRPKLVQHTHTSYPIGHLSTMYWLGLQPGDVHLNISSPGWAKHAWSLFFAPFLAEATVLVFNYARFDADTLLGVLRRCGVSTFCAPPTVWRMLIQADLGEAPPGLREALGAGEPLNPEVIEQVRRAWGLQIRDGFGQTETTAQVGNPPGQAPKDGSMGRPLPGYRVVLVDPATGERGDEGEICLDLAGERPVGLMAGYAGDEDKTAAAMAGGVYHTGDVAVRDADGHITFVGRTDDVFKASDYRISPFELESALLEHDAVAEAAVVPSPDPLRLAVPKAYVTLAAGHEPTEATAHDILAFVRGRLAPYKRIRRIEFTELPKTISGKIRRVELRAREEELHGPGAAGPVAGEFTDDALSGRS